jgi:hypothetical protein
VGTKDSSTSLKTDNDSLYVNDSFDIKRVETPTDMTLFAGAWGEGEGEGGGDGDGDG